MPVTIQVASHPAERIDVSQFEKYTREWKAPSDATLDKPSTRFLQCVVRRRQVKQVLQSLLSDDVATSLMPEANGLVHTCLEAYNHHRHLVLRPDDVWIAIISQFSFYVNKHAEKLRSYFVAHQDKKELEIVSEKTNFLKMTVEMADFLQANVLDKDLQSWIVPSFSTTTEIDTIVCSSIMMSTMKQYFSYEFTLMCGIPSVTLLGDISDWESILGRLSKLTTFGSGHPQLDEWKKLLTPVIQNMISSFHLSESQSAASTTVDFWSRIALYERGGSGPTYLSGWITAFCVFSSTGEWQVEQRSKRHPWDCISELSPSVGAGPVDSKMSYPDIDTNKIPPAWCETPVTITYPNGTKVTATIIAGLVGYSAFPFLFDDGDETQSEDERDGDEIQVDAVQPFPTWWICTMDNGEKGEVA